MKNREAEKANPCLKEQEATYKCFHDNDFDKTVCQLHIENYKTCKAFWSAIKLERRKAGTKPYLPLPEEREQIKQEYFTKFNVPR